MLTGKLVLWHEAHEEIEPIRRMVFVEEQGFPADEEFDDIDAIAIHALICEGDTPIATGRVYAQDGVYHAGRFAVLQEHRGKSAGEMAVRMVCRKAFDAGAPYVEIRAQTRAQGFYERIGFQYAKDAPDENGVPHVRMRLTEAGMYAARACAKGQ